MAVTIYSTPQLYAPSDNPLSFTFGSDQTGQTNFSYKVQTILDGTVVSEDQVFAQSSNRGHFDCSPIVMNLMQLPRITNDLSTNMDIISTLVIRVTERYGDPIADQDSADSVSVNTFKASLPDSEWEDKDFEGEYLDNLWLTDAPDNVFRVIRGQAVIGAMLTSGLNSLVVRFYDSSDILLDTYSVAHAYQYWQVNLSSTNLSAVYLGVDYNDVAYFTTEIGASDVCTYYYVDDYCNGIHSLVWMNKYGTFDQYPIEHYVSSESTVQVRSYKKKYGNFSGTDFVYDVNSSGNLDFEKTITDKGTLVTNYMTDTIQNWFVSTYDTLTHFLYNTEGILFRINVKSLSYKKKNGRFDELIMEELRYEKTMPRKSIRL